jgi:hypothetical protein
MAFDPDRKNVRRKIRENKSVMISEESG